MLLAIMLNNIGIFGAMTYYNIKLGSITDKKEIKRYVLSMFLYFMIIVLNIGYIKPISNGITLAITFGSYILIMKVLNNRNLFYSLFEIIYYVLNTILAQTAFAGLYIFPRQMTLVQFRNSVFSQAVLSVFSVLTYFIVSKLIGKKIFKFRETIWEKRDKEIKYFIHYFGLFLVWYSMVDVVIAIYKKGPMKENLFMVCELATISFIIVSVGVFLVGKNFLQKKEILDLEEFANKDEMTGALNRRAGLSYLQNELKSNRKEKTNLIVGFVDINRLKYVNDLMGHAIGDQLICHVVDHLRKNINPDYKMIRMGGDEFLIVYRDSTLEDVKAMMISLLEHVNDEKPEVLQDVEISFSFGFSEYDQKQLSCEELIQKADEEMYQNKMLYKQSVV